MTSYRAPLLLCAAVALGLAVPTARGDVPAELACRRCRPATTSAFAGPPACCPDPCERVGPIRRLLRRVFRPCCKPAAPCCPPALAVAPPPVVAAPPLTAPGAPADLGRPFVPPAPGGVSRREAPRLTPPSPPPPVRVDRIASGEGSGVQATLVSRASKPVPNAKVALIHAERANVRKQLAADGEGRINAELEAGTWLVYSRDANGRFVYRGKLEVTGKDAVRAKLLVE